MKTVDVTHENFEEEVLRSQLPVLVDFYADWCGPCRMLAPVMEEIANEFAGKIKVCRVNADEETKLAARYRVNALPTVIAFRTGELVDSSVGYKTRQQILMLLR